ncbi:MAG: hypothetical protein AABY01_01110 [Nanoarchaeota archaeon]
MKTIHISTDDVKKGYNNVKKGYKNVKNSIVKGTKKARASISKAQHKTEHAISNSPKAAVAIAAGVGAVIGATGAAIWNHNRNKNAAKAEKSANSAKGGRMTAAKNRASKSAGGKGHVKNRPAGKKILR